MGKRRDWCCYWAVRSLGLNIEVPAGNGNVIFGVESVDSLFDHRLRTFGLYWYTYKFQLVIIL
jgi:hypothetical protein